MANPIIGRPDAFQPASPSYVPPAGYQPPGAYPPPGYQAPNGWDQPTYANPYPQQTPTQAPALMTFDDVVTKTAISLGVVVAAAAASWMLLPWDLLVGAAMISGLVAVIVSFVVAARRTVSPGLTLLFAALEGVAIGAFSKIFELSYPGIVVQAVVGTFIAAGLTLGAYRYANFRISSKMRKILSLAIMGFVAVSLLNLVLFMFGINLGIVAGVTGPVSPLAWIFSLLGVGLAVFAMVDDFQYVEYGIRVGAPASESWRAAFGLTVTLVWLYTELLRIMSYFRR